MKAKFWEMILHSIFVAMMMTAGFCVGRNTQAKHLEQLSVWGKECGR